MPAMAKRNWISNRNRNHGRHSGTNPDTSGGRSVIHRAIPAPNDRYRSIYPHHDTPFGTEPAGSVGMTLKLLSLFRLMHPSALIPSTTALATLSPDGREKGILAGANVVMPNLPRSKEKNTPCMITKPPSVPKQPKVYELWHNNWKQSVTGYRQIEVTITNP